MSLLMERGECVVLLLIVRPKGQVHVSSDHRREAVCNGFAVDASRTCPSNHKDFISSAQMSHWRTDESCESSDVLGGVEGGRN